MASQELIRAIDSYEDYIRRKGEDEQSINAFVAGTQVAFSEKDIDYALKVSASAKQHIENFVLKQTGGTVWDLEKYAFANKTYYDILEKHYSVLKCEAQNKVVESYFLYLEKNREPRERFYAPKRKQFAKFGLVDAYQGMLDDKYDILCISMVPGSGKAQPLYSKVLTPDGFIRMGDVKVGTKVISGTGNVCNVVGVYPQGAKSVYQITLDDGSTCRCSDEHLWKVQTIEDRAKNKYRIIKTKDMVKNLWRGKQRNYSIEYVPKINMDNDELEINPYLLGYMLGNGNFTNRTIGFATQDYEILEKIKEILPDSCEVVQDAKYNFRIKENGCLGRSHKTKLRIALERYGLYGKHAHEKFIPKEYLYSKYKNRIELLRGLLDSDGYVSKCGYAIEYTSTSKQLANDVSELVHSLGGYASISEKQGAYKNKNNEKVNCKIVYRISIQFVKKTEAPFFVRRKQERYSPKEKTDKRFIDKIEYIGEEECQCIYVDDESHLYITDNYIITHNTTMLKFFNSGVIGWFPKDYNLFYSHSGDITRMYYDGVYQIVSDSLEYTWHEIFPDLQITSTNAKMQQFNIGSYKPFPSLQTAAVGSENAGKVRASKFLLVDDMIGKLEEALNKNILEKLWGAYTVDARQRKTMDSDNKPCKEIIQATRWSTLDPIGRVIQMYGGNERVKVISIPDIDPVTGESNFNYEFQGFTVDFFNDQALLMDDISYRCLYKQEPIEREGLLYHENEVRRYSSLPDREPDAIIGVCDTKSKGIDYMVLPCFYQYDNDFYMVDCVCDNTADYAVQYKKISDLILEHKMQQCEFESNAGGDRLAHEINKIVEDNGGRCNITTKATETNKETRIIVNSDWIKKHCLFKNKEDYTPKSDYGTFMNFMFSYSIAGKNKFDDVCDCLANFALYISRGKRVATVEAVQNPFRTGTGGYGYYDY